MEKTGNKIILTKQEYESLINANPLTGLPGNKIIKTRINEIFLKREDMYLIYFDISDFKIYNDIYGFERGDIVIKEIAEISKKLINKAEFLGHIGGDDFIAIIKEKNLNPFITSLFTQFKNKLPDFYSRYDYERGFIITFNREGFREKIKLVGITAVCFKNNKKFRNHFDVAEYGAALKKKAKNLKKLNPDNFIFLKEDKKEFSSIKKIIEGDYPLDIKRSLIEAIGEAKDILYLDYFLELLKKEHINYLIKKSILFSIGIMQEKKVSSTLVEFSKSNNPHLRMRAIEAIGNLGLISLEDIVKERMYDRNRFVLKEAIRTAGKLNLRNLADELKKYLNHTSRDIRVNSILSLAQLGNREIIPQLFEILDKKENINIKKAVLRALSSLGEEKEFNRLVEYYKTFEFKLKLELLIALRNIIGNKEIKTYNIEKFKEPLSSTSWRIRRLTVEILSYFKNDRRVEDILTEIINTEKTELVKARAILALKNFPSKRSIFILKKHLKTDIPLIKENCIIALSKIATEKELEDLRILLKDENKRIRELSANAIITLLRRRIVKWL